MKIAFVTPGYEQVYGHYRHLYRRGFLNPPMSLCYLASAVRKAGHTALIIDGEAEGLSTRTILERLERFSPHLIGFTATSVNLRDVCLLADEVKVNRPQWKTILGGTHTSLFGAEAMKGLTGFDYGCIGDGEDLIVELVEALSGDGSVEGIRGLLWRRDGMWTANPLRELERQLDRYVFPSRDLLNNELYERSVPGKGFVPAAAFMSTRGCPYSCIYCAVKGIYGGPNVRIRSAQNVLDELEEVVRRFGIRHVCFNDDCLTIKRDRMLAICEGINSRDLQITWEGLSRADLLDYDLLKQMRRAGCVRLSIGIESADNRMLQFMGKNETIEQIAEAIDAVKRAGIVTRGSVIIGLPHETRETVEKTFRFILGLKALDQVIINILQPYPGTPVRDMVSRHEGGSRFCGCGDDDSELQRFGKAHVAVNDLSPEDLVRLQREGFRRFYMRPSAVWNGLKITGMNGLIKDAVAFARAMLGK